MSGEFEELVRESMEWFAGDVRVPAGLAGKARRHHRRRLLAVRAAIAAGTAAVLSAAAVLAVTGVQMIADDPLLHDAMLRAW